MKKPDNYNDLKGKKAREYIKYLESLGYQKERQSGSHAVYTKVNRPIVALAYHSPNDIISPGQWRNIVKQLSV